MIVSGRFRRFFQRHVPNMADHAPPRAAPSWAPTSMGHNTKIEAQQYQVRVVISCAIAFIVLLGIYMYVLRLRRIRRQKRQNVALLQYGRDQRDRYDGRGDVEEGRSRNDTMDTDSLFPSSSSSGTGSWLPGSGLDAYLLGRSPPLLEAGPPPTPSSSSDGSPLHMLRAARARTRTRTQSSPGADPDAPVLVSPPPIKRVTLLNVDNVAPLVLRR